MRQIRELSEREFAPRTVGADKGYHSKDFVQGCRGLGVAPHVPGCDITRLAPRDRRRPACADSKLARADS